MLDSLKKSLHRLRYSRLSWGYAKANLYIWVQRAGVILVQRRGEELSAHEATEVYDPVMYHVLLLDRLRMNAYRSALQRHALGRRVLDIGTGASAILARMAIAGGAQEAVGVEANPESFAAATARENDPAVQGKLKIEHGFSTELESDGLPRFDLLVHEIIGSIGSEEGAPVVVSDAKRRLLTADAVHIPSACRTLLSPVMPLGPLRLIDSLASRVLCTGETAPDRTGVYFASNFPKDKRISEPQVFESFEFARELELVQKRELRFQIGGPPGLAGANSKVLFDGFVLWIELAVDTDLVLDSLIQKTSWAPIYAKVLDEPVALQIGDELIVYTEADVQSLTSSYYIRVTLPSGRVAESRWRGFW